MKQLIRGKPRPLWSRMLRKVRHYSANTATSHAVHGNPLRALTWGRIAATCDRWDRSPYALTWDQWRGVLASYRRAVR